MPSLAPNAAARSCKTLTVLLKNAINVTDTSPMQHRQVISLDKPNEINFAHNSSASGNRMDENHARTNFHPSASTG